MSTVLGEHLVNEKQKQNKGRLGSSQRRISFSLKMQPDFTSGFSHCQWKTETGDRINMNLSSKPTYRNQNKLFKEK